MILVLGLGSAGAAQQDEIDWDLKVEQAVGHRRYAVRRSASEAIAAGGDAAVDAVRRYQEAHGRESIPLLLADAYARTDSAGDALVALLGEWAEDPAFYWRSHALTALAVRKIAAAAPIFEAALGDPSHLYRVAGAKGIYLLAADDGARAPALSVLADPDPRARVAFAVFVAEQLDVRGVAPLVAALADDREFLGDAWARRLAMQAIRPLAALAGGDFGYDRTANLADNAAAIERFAAWAEIPAPALQPRDGEADLGGVEVRSCRSGDLFLRWTADAVHLDLDRGRRQALPGEQIDALEAQFDAARRAAGESARQVFGNVVCDYVQITDVRTGVVLKCAPGSVPAEIGRWLRTVSATLRAAGAEEMAVELERRLPQFLD